MPSDPPIDHEVLDILARCLRRHGRYETSTRREPSSVEFRDPATGGWMAVTVRPIDGPSYADEEREMVRERPVTAGGLNETHKGKVQ